MDVNNLRYNAFGGVDCEIEHPVYGWIPFTAMPTDSDGFGRELFAKAVAGELGPVAAYAPWTDPADPDEPNPVVQLSEADHVAFIQQQRLRAYADPLNGSDRFFSEATRMQVMGEIGWENVRDAGVARYLEIRALYPWP